MALQIGLDDRPGPPSIHVDQHEGTANIRIEIARAAHIQSRVFLLSRANIHKISDSLNDLAACKVVFHSAAAHSTCAPDNQGTAGKNSK